MKVDLKLDRSKPLNFEGYKVGKNAIGAREYHFNYPFNSADFDCYLELFSVAQDKNNNYYVTDILSNFYNDNNEIKVEPGVGVKVDLAGEYGISKDDAFAYHYKLYPKKGENKAPRYVLDPGMILDFTNNDSALAHNVYNLVPSNSSTVSKSGAMKLIVPDSYNVAWVYDNDNRIVPNKNVKQARRSNKNFANKIGGSLAGIEKDLDDGKLDNYTRIITTPIFTDDNISSHAYWNKNNFQIAQNLGNINNYVSLQKKLFAKGINLVADGAIVNEGLEGVHFRHILKWGDKSPYFHWFNISGLVDSPLSLGVFGKNGKHVTHRLVNSPYKFEQKNGIVSVSRQKYDSNKPTYIQIYDDRLVNAEKLSNKDLIRAYDKLVNNVLEINNHNDTVVPYSFRINPETYLKNIKDLNNYNKKVALDDRIDFKSFQGTKFLTTFEYFGLDGKHENGFETWDANTDIPKLSYVSSHAESQIIKNTQTPELREAKKKLLQRKHFEAQDYAISSAKYWSKKTNEILVLHTAKQLKNLDGKDAQTILQTISAKTDGKALPKDLDIDKNVVKNVLSGLYSSKISKREFIPFNELILKNIMDVPLDSIEVGDDIISVLASPYVTKRATKEEQIGLSRYDMFINKNPHITPEYYQVYKYTDEMYTHEMYSLAKNILTQVNEKLPDNTKLWDVNGYATSYGKYVVPMLAQEIVKFAVIKSVSPKTDPKINNTTGEISYDYKNLKNNTSLLSMGIIPDCPEDEAKLVISKLRNGMRCISDSDKLDIVEALCKSIQGTDTNSFKFAEVIVGRAQAGLDWRIDATKDIADIESVRRGADDFEHTWNKIIKFWKKYNDAVKEYHPDAYIAAEITDESAIYSIGNGHKSNGRYSNVTDAVQKLLNEGGFTTMANYSYLSSDVNKIFGKLFDFDGEWSPDKGVAHSDTIKKVLNEFLKSGSLESILYSYTFVGNHDKCRAIDGYAMDMDMVYADLTDANKHQQHRMRAYKILNALPFDKNPTDDEINKYDFSRVSGLCIARCESISSGIGKAINKTAIGARHKEIYGAMLDALKNISLGKHLGQQFESAGFGSKDYPAALNVVFDEMNYTLGDKKLSPDERRSLFKNSMEMILDPAMSKLLAHIKFIAALPGNPTLFAGDDLGSTGYETTTKNMTLQNRNVVHDEWADPNHPDYMEFIKRHKDYVEYQFNQRTRKELQPLNDGTPYILNLQKAWAKIPVYASADDNFYGNASYYNDSNANLSAILRQSPNGAMTVSVFNTEGLTHKFDEYYRPPQIFLNHIDLAPCGSNNQHEKVYSSPEFTPGTEFINADKNDTAKYVVNQYQQIVRKDGNPINFKDSVLTLHTAQPTFTGRKVLFNPQYNIISQPYNVKEKVENGSKLSIISK